MVAISVGMLPCGAVKMPSLKCDEHYGYHSITLRQLFQEDVDFKKRVAKPLRPLVNKLANSLTTLVDLNQGSVATAYDSLTMCGVMRRTTSRRSLSVISSLNKAPSKGISPRIGTFSTVTRSVSWIKPESINVWPSLSRICCVLRVRWLKSVMVVSPPCYKMR